MIVGYHTVEDRNNPDVILLEGPFRCEREDAWLGHGYYFWDTDIGWAHKWGKDAYRKQNYVICRADIENHPDVMFDLVGNVAHIMEFEEMIKLLEADASYQRERPLVAEIVEFMKKRGFFTYKAIRAADNPPSNVVEVDFRPPKYENQPTNRPFMRLGQRVQICLLEKSEITLQDFSIVFPEKYL